MPDEPLEGPLEVRLLFYFSRPKNHYRSGRYAHILKDGADCWHIKRNGKMLVCICVVYVSMAGREAGKEA